MSFEDKSLQCSDCGATFTFSAEEQEFFANKGFTNEPKRCSPCRQTRKDQRRSSQGVFSGYSYQRREMFSAVCASCGKNTQVPFGPIEGQPVYAANVTPKLRAKPTF